MQDSPNVERLEMERETANESTAAPRDLLWPRHTLAPHKTVREILFDDPLFGFYARREA